VPGIHVVDGMPGVGKTALVVHAAHLLADRFPDGQLYINMNAHTAGQRPVEPSDALAALLAAVGVPAAGIPAGAESWAVTEARAALWRDRLAGRRVLLVLDNVVGYEQIRPLLPGTAGCLVLVTSRNRITALSALHNASTHPLDTLSPSDAAALFTRIAGRVCAPGEADAVAALVRWCGYLPLAVAVLAGRLRHRPAWTAADLAADTATAKPLGEFAADSAVTAAFAMSYRGLPAARQRLFRSFGAHPGTDMDVYAVAALAGTSITRARDELAALYDAHLIDEPSRGRYRLHDLLRDYARSLRQSPAEHDNAVDRLLVYYQHTAAAASTWLYPPAVPSQAAAPQQDAPPTPELPTAAAAVDWLQTERANLQACASYTAEHGLHERMTSLAITLGPFLLRGGPWDQMLRLYQDASACAGHLSDPRVHARVSYWLGQAYHANDNLMDARRALHAAVDAFAGLGDRVEQAQALMDLGWLHRDMGDFPAAVEASTQALAIYCALGELRGQAAALAGLGHTRFWANDYRGAAAALAQALELSEQVDFQHGRVFNRFQLGLVALRTGDYTAAKRAIGQHIATFQEVEDLVEEAWTYYWLGLVERLTGDLTAAEHAQRHAAGLMDQLGDRGVLWAVVHRELALIQTAIGDHDAAEQSLTDALTTATRIGQAQPLAEVLNAAGTVLLNRGHAEAALSRHHDALEFADKGGSPLEHGNALLGIARCARHLGDLDAAETDLRQALRIFERIGVPDASTAAEELASLSDERTQHRPA